MTDQDDRRLRWGIRVRKRDEPRIGPPAPGAVESPQMPGEVPDRSTIPGHRLQRMPHVSSVARPQIEAGTAQGIMSVFLVPPERANDPKRFEQATASYEEIRKAYPAQLPPTRPAPGYALTTGNASASEVQEIGGPLPTPPAIEPGSPS
jgi:hypothetical protein